MININIEGKLPELNTDMSDAMENIADIMYRSVQENFIRGGRPNQWQPLSPFGESSHLYQSGRMFESIQLETTSESASVFIDTARIPYAAIHNYGGTIKHPGSYKFQVFYYMGGTVFTQGTKAHDIPIPQRQFMMFQEEDMTRILDVLSTAIFYQDGRRIN